MTQHKDIKFITIKDLWEIFRKHLSLFIISITLALVIGIFVILTRTPMYERTASIILKSETTSNPLLESMGLSQQSNDIKNEVHVLSAPKLMREAILRLGVQKEYSYKHNNLRWIDLYSNSPFEVVLSEPLNDVEMSFFIKFSDNKHFCLDNITIDGKPLKTKITGAIGDKLTLDLGNIAIITTKNTPSLSPKTSYRFTNHRVDKLSKDYCSILNSSLRDNSTSIIDLSLTLSSVEKAEDLLNTLINVYQQSWIDENSLASTITDKFIEERLVGLEKELGGVDKIISNYKSDNLIMPFDATASVSAAWSNENLRKQIELNNQLSMANYLKQYIETKQKDSILPVNIGMYSQAIEAQINKYNETQLYISSLKSSASESNPIIVNAQQQLQALKEILILSINQHIATLQAQLSREKEQERESTKKLSNTPMQELFLLSKGREQKIKEELYLFLLQKREENQLKQAYKESNCSVLNPASGDSEPISKEKKLIIVLSLIVGFALPSAFIILKMALNTTVKTKEDLHDVNIPYLGHLPNIKAKKSDKKRNSSEAFKVLRDNLDFMLGSEKGCKIIQIISLEPESGKTLICANLAKSVSLKGSKVLVIDCDMRMASLSKLMGEQSQGLSKILNGNQELTESLIIRNIFETTMDGLSVGVLPPNPSELLLGDDFSATLDKLKANYDYIFLDCPPIDIVTDSSLVAKYCNCAIFVVRAGKFDKRALPELNRIYSSGKYNNLSLILNSVDETHNTSYGNYTAYHYGNKVPDEQSKIIGID